MRRNSINSDLINRRQEYWDSVIESCGKSIQNSDDIPNDLGYDLSAKSGVAEAAWRMQMYDRRNFPREQEGSLYWKNDPSYWWHKKYTI